MEERILAEQLVFARVEAPYSPNHRGGFQTVYRSQGLRPNVVEEIEKRVRCYHIQRDQPVERIQFFQVGGAYGLSQTVPIPGHPEIVDRMGRDGAFMVHCLLLDRTDLAAIDCNPFHVFASRDSFYRSLEPLIDEFGQATGRASRRKLHIRRQPFPEITWPADAMESLARSTFSARRMTQEGDSVLIMGDQAAIREALQLAFCLIPPSTRATCTFDSHIAGCPTPPGSYWAVGSTSRTSRDWFIEVDASNQCVVRGQVPDVPDNEYARWLTPILRERDLQRFRQQAHTVQALYETMEYGIPLRREQLTPEGCEAFYRHNRQTVIQKFSAAVAAILNARLADLMTAFAFQRYQPSSLIPIAVSQEVANGDLAQVLTDYMLALEQPEFRDSEWQLVQEIARGAGDNRLLHWASSLMENADVATRDRALAAMDRVDYERALEKLLHPIAPEHFVIPEHLSLLIERVSQRNVTDEQFVGLVESILDSQQAHYLLRLTSRVKTTDRRFTRKLKRVLNRNQSVPVAFRQAVERRMTERKSSFLKNRMLGLIRFKR